MTYAFASAIMLAITTQPSTRPINLEGVSLWGPLRSGMTKDQVKALEPKVVTISEQCRGWLEHDYENKKLKAVTLNSSRATPECALLTEKTLLTKYGTNPTRTTKYVTGNCGYGGTVAALCRAMGGDKTVRYDFAEWITNGTRITLTRSNANNDWTVEYTIEPQVTADAKKAF